MTQWFLEDLHADPTIDVPTGGESLNPNDREVSDTEETPTAGSRRTAYNLAKTKAVRNVFRRCAGSHPDWWDWLGSAKVQSVLTKDMEEVRDEKKKVRRKGLKDKIREREEREKEKVVSDPVPEERAWKTKSTIEEVAGPRKLGGSSGSTEGVAGLTPEMRARIERERRARAAEARLKGSSR